jgi:hypothetical protein
VLPAVYVRTQRGVFVPTWTKVQASSAINYMLDRNQHIQEEGSCEEDGSRSNELYADSDSQSLDEFVERCGPSPGRREPQIPEY